MAPNGSLDSQATTATTLTSARTVSTLRVKASIPGADAQGFTHGRGAWMAQMGLLQNRHAAHVRVHRRPAIPVESLVAAGGGRLAEGMPVPCGREEVTEAPWPRASVCAMAQLPIVPWLPARGPTGSGCRAVGQADAPRVSKISSEASAISTAQNWPSAKPLGQPGLLSACRGDDRCAVGCAFRIQRSRYMAVCGGLTRPAW